MSTWFVNVHFRRSRGACVTKLRPALALVLLWRPAIRAGVQGRRPVLSASATLCHYKLAAHRRHCLAGSRGGHLFSRTSGGIPASFTRSGPRVCVLSPGRGASIRTLSPEVIFLKQMWFCLPLKLNLAFMNAAPSVDIFRKLILPTRYGKMWTFIPVLSNKGYVGGAVYQSGLLYCQTVCVFVCVCLYAEQGHSCLPCL